MKLILNAVKPLLMIAASAVLLGAAACTSAATSTSNGTVQLFPPDISYVHTTVSERDEPSVMTDVNYYVSLTEFDYTQQSHVIYYYDVQPPTDPTKPAYTSNGTYIAQQDLGVSAAWKSVPVGAHTFSAQVVDLDDKPYDPPIIAQNIIDIPPPGPELRLFSIQMNLGLPESLKQATPQPLPALQIQIMCLSNNFKLNDDAVGKQNVAGEGHFIYYLDTEPPAVTGQSAIPETGNYKVTTETFHVWENVPAGRHEFAVQLVNNDNTPLEHPVLSRIIVEVPSSD